MELFKKLVAAGIRFRNTPIVDDDFPVVRDSFDWLLTEAERSLKPVTVVNNENIPEGYKEDASGALRPISSIKTTDLMRDELVQKLVARATDLNAQLKAFKQEALTEIAAFVELSAAEHAVKLGGQKGNVTLTSYDGAFKVLRANHNSISFNEQIHAAKALIDECLRDWTGRPGIPQGLIAAVNASFKRNAQGHLSVSRIMEMRSYDVPDERWNRAMNIIADSIHVLGTITYLRIQKRLGRTEKYEAIALDIAGV